MEKKKKSLAKIHGCSDGGDAVGLTEEDAGTGGGGCMLSASS